MDILIKNMEMPSEGRIINLTICSDGSVINNLPDAGGKMSSYRSERAKAVALPEHHGRLGDLDALQKQIEDDIETVAKEKGKVGLRELWQILNKNIENAPVIVEANYGTDN